MLKYFKKVSIALGVTVSLLVGNAVITYSNINEIIKSQDNLATSIKTLRSLERTLSIVKDAETGTRGYVITGDLSFLEPYYYALESIDSQYKSLEYFIRENYQRNSFSNKQSYITTQTENLKVLQANIKSKLNTSTNQIEIRRQKGFEASQELVASRQGKRIMDDIRILIERMEETERSVLLERSREIENISNETFLTFSLANLGLLLLLGFILTVIKAHANERILADLKIKEIQNDLEVRVKERTIMLEQVNEDLKQFSYSVSHDLKSSLRAVLIFSQNLLDKYNGVLDEAGVDYAVRIRRAASRMDQMLQDIVAYSKINHTNLELVVVNTNEIVKDVLSQLEIPILESKAKIFVNEPLLPVMGDIIFLVQIILNLVGNALKFVEPGISPQIGIYTEYIENGKYVRLWVEDQGIGISEEDQAFIFEIFKRLHGTSKYPGSGIGLAVVQKAAQRLGGNVGVVSKLGTGSKFYVDLLAPS